MRALAAIRSMDVASDWPFDAEAEEGTTGETVCALRAASYRRWREDEASLAQEYRAYSWGLGHLAAAPWGVGLFGSRQSALWLLVGQSFAPGCASMVLIVKYDDVPEDQIGRILVLSAEVALQKTRASS